MATATDPVIEIDTATAAPPVGRTAWVRIGGTAYEARCPKDAVLFDIYQGDTRDLAVVRQLLAAMLGTQAASEVEAMLTSPDHPDVSYVTLFKVVSYLMSDEKGPRWSDAVAESMKQLGSGKTPTTRKVAAAPAKTATKKPAAKKTAAKKPARK